MYVCVCVYFDLQFLYYIHTYILNAIYEIPKRKYIFFVYREVFEILQNYEPKVLINGTCVSKRLYVGL